MLKSRRWITGINAICLIQMVAGSQLHAQRRGNDPQFEKKSPVVGELLPDITAYDADGSEFALRSIKDNYSVIVFGCLT